MSRYHNRASRALSSVVPLQSSSRPLQTSVPAGETDASVSRQSSLFPTNPEGSQRRVPVEGSPYPSPSRSSQETSASTAPASVDPSQSSSIPLQTSTASGW